MPQKPLDYYLATRIGRVKAARLFSNIVSPPVMFAILGLALAWKELLFWPGFVWGAFYGLLVSLAPILFVLFLLRTGRIAELHMSNTEERHLPYLVAVGCALLALGGITLLNGPELLRCLALFNVIELIALGAVNVYWLISIHATGIMATMLIAGLVFGWEIGLAILPLVALISWVRLYLQRHTPMQIIAGLGLGVVTVLAMVGIGCF